jgi:hypothetical protein
MCFSLAGRLQTRLVSLLPATVIALLLLALSGDPRYLTMILVMAVAGVDLDTFAYSRIFGYQPRWTIYLLGVLEFAVTFAVVRSLDGTLWVSDIVKFYVGAWILGQLAVNVVLPTIDLSWTEHGGEIWRPASRELAPGPFMRMWDALRLTSADSLTVLALLILLALDLSLLPSSLRPLQAAAAVVGALLAAVSARRLAPERAPRLAGALTAGLALSLLLRGAPPLIFLAGGAAAVLITTCVRLGGKPALNGIAGAFLLALLLGNGAYTADGEWGNSLLLPLLMTNVVLLLALRRGRLPLAAAFLAVVISNGLAGGLGQHEAVLVILPRLLQLPVLFFAGFLLIDEETTPSHPVMQAVAGLAVAVLGLALSAIGLHFVVALLLVNYFWSLLRLLPGGRSAVPAVTRGSTVSRRAFLAAASAAAGGVLIGGSMRRLSQLDPAALSLPADAALAGGQAIPRFRDVAQQAGIVLRHTADRSEGSPAIGTGVAWADFDRDGRIDLYVTDHMGPCHLYRNNGDGTFTDVAVAAGVAHPGMHATSATFVDYNNDGWPDLYVGIAHGPNRLYRNNGDGSFTDVTEESGLGDTGRTMSTAWADYDGDGYLDVFVANYPDGPVTFDAHSTPQMNTRTVMQMPHPTNHLFHNNGDGTFTDVSHLLSLEATWGFGFAAVWFDYNRDGRPDLYAVYDFGNIRQPNTLWRNDGPGPDGWQFTQVQNQMGVATRANPMGATTGDYNNDGWQDLAVTDIGPNFLYRNQAGTGFQEVAQAAHVAHASNNVTNMLDPSMTWGITFADYNNDGWLDLYLVAGTMDFQHVPQPNALYMNDGAGRFVDVSTASGTDDPGQGRSVAVADFDGDGYLDMFVANYGEPPLLYRNLSRSLGNRWLRLDLEGTQSNRDAVGAQVTVYAAGMKPQLREVQIGQGLGSCNERTLHFGLGRATRAERVEIRWPSGRFQVIHAVNANQTLHITEPARSRWV